MLFEHLFAHARATPDEIAITDNTGQYTYGRLAAMTAGLSMVIGRTAAASHVGLLLPAGTGFVASFYGTLLAGKSVVPINFLLSEGEVAHVIADSGIDTVVTIPQLAGRLKDTPLKIIDLTQLSPPPPPPPPPPAAPPAAITRRSFLHPVAMIRRADVHQRHQSASPRG